MDTDMTSALLGLEHQLRQLDLWQVDAPPAQALASSQPFCIDTLTPPQWLQFVFLPTLHTMLERELALPQTCGITPLVEEFFKGSSLEVAGLLAALERVDRLLSGG